MKIPRLSNHGSEIGLLALIAVGVIALLVFAIDRGIVGSPEAHGFDVAAFLLILQRIIEAVQGRWTQRGIDQMGVSLANAPASDPPAPRGTTALPEVAFGKDTP